MEKDLEYWKKNAEEDYRAVPISVLKYITQLEKAKHPKKNIKEDFAVSFAEWLLARALGFESFKLNKNEMKMYKEEKGL